MTTNEVLADLYASDYTFGVADTSRRHLDCTTLVQLAGGLRAFFHQLNVFPLLMPREDESA
jgi:hypothetical protein